MDDILLAAPTNQITNILDSFNAYHERIKFTVDYGDEFGISFLDVKLLYDKGSIIFDLYTKPTRRDTSIFSQITLPYTKKVWWLGCLTRFYSYPIQNSITLSSIP